MLYDSAGCWLLVAGLLVASFRWTEGFGECLIGPEFGPSQVTDILPTLGLIARKRPWTNGDQGILVFWRDTAPLCKIYKEKHGETTTAKTCCHECELKLNMSQKMLWLCIFRPLSLEISKPRNHWCCFSDSRKPPPTSEKLEDVRGL